jgi:hypothetical protein
MKFTLRRCKTVDSLGVRGVAGYLENEGDFHCLTLEGFLTLCPSGTYRLQRGFMETHKVYRAQLMSVPGHTGVFIHSGEKASDSRMCPLVGDRRPTPGTLAGGTAHHVADKLADLVGDNANCTIEILDIPETPNFAMNQICDGVDDG